jgi:hypothetical protein
LTGQSAEHKYGHPLDGAVAQLGERVVRNDEVRSSILLSSTSGLIFPLFSSAGVVPAVCSNWTVCE